MSRIIIGACVLFVAGVAHAGIPMLNVTCPGNLVVHADQGGPVHIDGMEVEVKKFNDKYYEARMTDLTVSISINPDGSTFLSYTGTGKHGAHGLCRDSDFEGTQSKANRRNDRPDS